jgi:hypothetical protein
MRWIAKALGTVCLACAAMASSVEGRACGNGVEIEVDPRVERLAAADRLLFLGKSVDAAKTALGVFPHVRSAQLGKDGLLASAMRVVAVAIVRMDGALTAGEFGAATDEEREANFEWAVTALRKLQLRRLNNPRALTELAEALAKRPTSREEARSMLEFLASADVVASWQGWAALAGLREEAGQSLARDQAIARCEQRAPERAACHAALAAPGGRT